jgi:competence protein ComEA
MLMLKKILALFLALYAALAMAASVDVNKANDAQLDAVKGIGPATSKAILEERKKGQFKDWQDFIDRVKGVGNKNAESLSKEGLTVNGDSYKGAAMTKKDAAKSDKKEADAKKDAAESKADAKADAKKAKAEAKKEAKEAKAEAKKDAASAKK